VAFLRGNTLYALSSPGSWADTRAVARQLGGDLTAINDSGENSDLQRAFSGGFWIGLNRDDERTRWSWSTGESSAYSNWVSGEPRADSSTNHAWMVNDLSYGQWATRDGENGGLPGLMEVPVIQRQSRAYLLAEAQSFEELERLARLLGGQVATISSQDTNAWLTRELPGLVQRRYGVTAQSWGRNPVIGLIDQHGDGDWRWVSGGEVALLPWAPGEPSDGGQSERHVELLISGPKAGQWNDGSFRGIGLLEISLAPNQPANGRLLISGQAQVGKILKVQPLNISDGDSVGGTTIQWQRRNSDRRGWQNIQGAQGANYILRPEDAQTTVRAVLSFRDSRGHDEVITSSATKAIQAKPQETILGLKGAIGLSGQMLQLRLNRSGEVGEDVKVTLPWPGSGLELLGGSPRPERLPGSIRVQLPAGQRNLNIPVAGQSEAGVGFVQTQLQSIRIENNGGLKSVWKPTSVLVRVMDLKPVPSPEKPVEKAPKAQEGDPTHQASQSYKDYVLNYGPSLLEAWREEGETQQLEVWGREHFQRLGQAAGRRAESKAGSMDWGAAVLYAPGLFSEWQQSNQARLGMSAFSWGLQQQALVRKANRVRIGTGQSDQIQGNLVFGLEGNDVLTGTQANDLLVGGYGQDVLTGGGLGGQDWIYGGPGRDRFVIDGHGTSWIRDFTPGEDDLALGSLVVRGDLRTEPYENGTGVKVLRSNGQVIADLIGVTARDIGF